MFGSPGMFGRLFDPDAALAIIEKRGTVAEAIRSIPPRLRALLGAGLGYAGMKTVTDPLAALIGAKAVEGFPRAESELPIEIKDDPKGADVLRWIDKFKKDHPDVESVPVFVSGSLPASLYAYSDLFKNPGARKFLKDELGIQSPGVYLNEMSAPIALHELGHAKIERKIPKISLLTHGLPLLSLPLLGYAILKKPGQVPAFLDKAAPLIVAALQVPALAEEAAASIIAERALRREGETGRATFLPAFLAHAVERAGLPLTAAAAMFLKRL